MPSGIDSDFIPAIRHILDARNRTAPRIDQDFGKRLENTLKDAMYDLMAAYGVRGGEPVYIIDSGKFIEDTVQDIFLDANEGHFSIGTQESGRIISLQEFGENVFVNRAQAEEEFHARYPQTETSLNTVEADGDMER